MTAPEIVRVDGVGKSFSTDEAEFRALDDVSLAVREGEFVSIVGPSGCGKSTLLQIIAGLSPATSGDVRIDNQPMTVANPDKVGVVFQDPLLLPWKTAAENIIFPLKLRAIGTEAERQARARELLELVGLHDFADHYPHQLSGGMRQRVAIARGLVRQPRVLLMDEPFGALDEQTRTRMWEELLAIRARSNTTVVFITHSLVEAVFLADIVLVMAAKPGRIIARIAIDLPRPRTADMLGSEPFGRLRNRLWDLIAA